MANKASAKKMIRKIAKRELINKSRKSSTRTAVKKFLVSIKESKPVVEVQSLFKEAQSALARAAGQGVFHAKTASRKVKLMHSKLKTYMIAD